MMRAVANGDAVQMLRLNTGAVIEHRDGPAADADGGAHARSAGLEAYECFYFYFIFSFHKKSFYFYY